MKIFGLLLMGIVVFLVLIILGSMLNHKIRLKKEESLIVPIGELVEVNGHKMHVYIEGQGDITLLFMSGGGTCSPVLDFKALYTKFSDKYRIVVIEKSGYGFSEISGVSRDIDTILEETRTALDEVGIEKDFVLMPHSMSGIEALYWARKYPEEVQAIIGLDPAVPEAYENYPMPSSLTINMISFASNIGLTRFIPSICSSSPAMQSNLLTEEEKNLYRAIFYRKTMTTDMYNELLMIQKNAKIVQNLEIPPTSMLFFVSNGEGTGFSAIIWKDILKSYISRTFDGKIVELECSHYVHDYEYILIAKRSKEFLSDILK